MGLILKTANLTKNYYSKKALKGINIELEEGKILGLLGPNGSGKTTFIKIAAGILRPTSGEILIDGQEPGIYTKSIVSYLPDINYLYRWMKIRDAINFFKDFYADFDIEKSKRLLDFMMLNENDKVTSLSKGMLEKLHLTLVLSRNAKLYIFDEPLGGIDPNTREKIIDAIIDNIREDSSMIISTHLVRDIERLFDDVAFISDGEIILKGNAEELRMERNKSIDEIFREVYE
ncbi:MULTISPECIES: ABC transporter ATP-binding protein [Thermoanaerobacterium]|uniref:ABC transporter relted protein n=1 Tax=Thermoanaerobacterium xylanolyticum (strain ATCC 49914 / DSM 7097 / LX-11) TaxID=858215 RepID=F6BLH9_THEXL|nr:ABC transporter ATP-binding protein [Thermoanaerobacterium xylanolyticum]AEF16155.1 ABC transporter relted protein [Thermoanaerobacterium xylanolyticum LX-11]